MTGIERAIWAVSDLYDFYMKTCGLREALKRAQSRATSEDAPAMESRRGKERRCSR